MNGADDNPLIIPHLERVSRIALLVGAAGAVLCFIAAWQNPTRFFPSYLMAFLLWFGVSMGCTALMMLYSVTGGRWGDTIRPTAETAARGVLLLAVLFIPILLFMNQTFPWARQAVRDFNPAAAHQFEVWLKPGMIFGFVTRAVIYWAVWLVMAWVINQRVRPDPATLARIPTEGHGDRGRDQPTAGHFPGGTESPSGAASWVKTFSAPGLVAYAITISLAAIDWVMSLQPGWYSTIYGFLFIASQGLSALCFCTVVLMFLTEWVGRGREPGAQVGRPAGSTISAGEPAHGPRVMPGDFNDLGNLMLTFTILWAYMSFSQFLIQWAGNIPEEVQYFKIRMSHGWGVLGLGLIALHFFLPFFCLLSRDLKRKATRLGALALFVLVMRQLDLFWFVSPSVNRGKGIWESLTLGDFAAPLAVGGLWIAFFAWQHAGRARQGATLFPPPAPDGHGAHGSHGAPSHDPVVIIPGTVAHGTQGGGHHG